MEFRVLGTIEVAGLGSSPSPPGAKERAILARLLSIPGGRSPSDELLDAAWQGVPREAAARSLAVRVANLRTFLEPDRPRGAPSSLLVRDGTGYRLAIAAEQVDAHRFERCVHARGRAPARRGARGLRRRAGAVARHAVRRPRRRRAGRRPRSAGSRTCGTAPRRAAPARSSSSAGRSRRSPTCAGSSPTTRCARSSPRTLMVALYAAGRQVEALEVYRELAARLRELGLRPGDATRELERRILEHDRTLRAPAPRRRRSPRRRRRGAADGAPRRPSAASASSPGCALALARARSAGRRAGVMVRGRAGRRQEHARRRVPRGHATRSSAWASASGTAGRASRTCPCSRRSARSRAGPAGETVVAALAQRAPTWLVELPWLLDDGPEAEGVRHRAQGATRARMLREALEALDAIGATAPVVLVLEDLHWADDSTLDLLAALLRRRDPARLLVLGTYRAGGRAADRRARPRPRRARPVRGAAAPAARRRRGRRLPARSASRPRTRAGRARRRAQPAHRRQPAVHAQPARPLARRRDARRRGRRRAAHAPARTCSRPACPPTLRAHIRDQLDRLAARRRRGARRRERRRPRLLRRHARRRARPRPRRRRGALRRARASARR